MGAHRRAPLEPACLPVGRHLAQALAHDRALAGVERFESGNLAARHVFRQVRDHRGVLAQERAKRARRDARRRVSSGQEVISAKDEAADNERKERTLTIKRRAGFCPVSRPRARWCSHHADAPARSAASRSS